MSNIEMFARLPQKEINIEGHAPNSPTVALSLGMRDVRFELTTYGSEQSQIIGDNLTTPEGHKVKILELGEKTVKKLQDLRRARVTPADKQIAKWDAELNIVEEVTDDDLRLKIYHWEAFGKMDKGERLRVANRAFVEGNIPVIRAVLDWETSMMEPFIPETVEAWRKEYAKARRPKIAEEWTTLKGDRQTLVDFIEQATSKVVEESGVGKTTMRDRLDPQKYLNDAQADRDRTVDQQLAGA